MNTDYDLLHGNAWIIADFLGVNTRTVKRWKSGTVPLPVPCRKLLALRFDGAVTALMGNSWNGFYFGADGEFYIPGWKYGFSAAQIRGMFFQVQQVRALERELMTMKTDKLGNDFVRSLIRSAFESQPPVEPVHLDISCHRKATDKGHQ